MEEGLELVCHEYKTFGQQIELKLQSIGYSKIIPAQGYTTIKSKADIVTTFTLYFQYKDSINFIKQIEEFEKNKVPFGILRRLTNLDGTLDIKTFGDYQNFTRSATFVSVTEFCHGSTKEILVAVQFGFIE